MTPREAGQPFLKMHAQGNAFVVLDERQTAVPDPPGSAIRLCDRHTGIGGDGLIVIQGSAQADHRMLFINPDGSIAETCGNALLCLTALLGAEREGRPLTIETGAGIVRARWTGDGTLPHEVSMGAPRWDVAHLPQTGPDGTVALGGGLLAYAVSMGNPHAVLLAERDGVEADLHSILPSVERHPLFPEGANVSAVCRTSDGLSVTIWERGAGWTPCCGSAACAVAAVASRWWQMSLPLRLRFPGGVTEVDRDGSGAFLYRGLGQFIARGTCG